MLRVTVFDRLARHAGNALSYLFLIVVCLASFEVVMRYVFGSPTYWVHEMSVALCAAAFIFAGAYVLQSREHIIISVLYDRLPRLVRGPLDVINALLAAAYLGALLYGLAVQAQKSIAVLENTGTASRLPTPMVMKSLLVIGVLLMLLQVLGSLVAHLRQLAAGRDS